MKKINLESEILAWAKERGILAASDPAKQIVYSVCEAMEIFLADSSHKFEDAIGDTIVTLVSVAHIGPGLTLTECKQRSRTVKSLAYDTWKYLDDYLKGRNTLADSIGTMVTHLEMMAHENKTTLDKCIQVAYSNISGRTGETVNGIFRKNEE